eukprot:6212520-Pleurochrysis_carterae.AAC.5
MPPVAMRVSQILPRIAAVAAGRVRCRAWRRCLRGRRSPRAEPQGTCARIDFADGGRLRLQGWLLENIAPFTLRSPFLAPRPSLTLSLNHSFSPPLPLCCSVQLFVQLACQYVLRKRACEGLLLHECLFRLPFVFRQHVSLMCACSKYNLMCASVPCVTSGRVRAHVPRANT